MNEVFLMGKIVNTIKFDFMANGKNMSIVTFEIETTKDRQILKIKAFDQIADFAYSKLSANLNVFIRGFLNNSGEIIVTKIKKL